MDNRPLHPCFRSELPRLDEHTRARKRRVLGEDDLWNGPGRGFPPARERPQRPIAWYVAYMWQCRIGSVDPSFNDYLA